MRLAIPLCFVAVLAVSFAIAQSQDRRARRDDGNGPPPDPILMLFDSDQNGELSSEEIDQATNVLRKLDQNHDGILDRSELPRPPRPDEGARPMRPTQRSETKSTDTSKLAKGTVVFHGGYETDPQDGGRPVVLVASGLGVEPQVFRDVFSNVRPAQNGAPSNARVHANKQVLLDGLSKYGVTNDRLDEVSNYYRYRPQSGELWTHVPAAAKATLKDGQVTAIDLTKAGAGYSSTPRVEIVGFPQAKVEVEVEYAKDLSTNGRIKSLKLVP